MLIILELKVLETAMKNKINVLMIDLLAIYLFSIMNMRIDLT